MALKVFDTDSAMSSAIAEEIAKQLWQKPESLICLAAGETSLGVFDALINLLGQKKIDFSAASFVAMDEWLGMSARTPGSCSDFLNQNFLSKVNFDTKNIRLIDGEAADIDAECAAVRAFIETRGGIDFLLLGVGMNGHLALNEPGVDFNLSVHQTTLDPVTQVVAKKYFATPNPRLVGGVTIGVREIRAANKIILSVSGARKQGILRRVVGQSVSNAVPATVLNEMPQADIYCDSDAASDIKSI